MRSPVPSSRRSTTRLRLLQLAGSALPSREPSPPRKVLLLRPDHVGDVLLTAPAVALLRTSLPNAHLTYLVGPWSTEAARHGPPVDNLRTLAYPGFTRRPNANVLAPYALLAAEALRLRRERYDLAIILRPDHWWGALLVLAAGIPLRVGGSTPETTPLLTHVYAPRCTEHTAERSLGIARSALEAVHVTPVDPGPVRPFTPSQAGIREADEIWQRHQLGGGRVVAMHPAAGARLKSWPTDSWARLTDSLLNDGTNVVFTGAPDDRPLLETIQNTMSHKDVPRACGQSLSATAALYERCHLVISVDSGAAHLAAAMGTPTLRLYGPASPSVFGPWPPRVRDRVLITDQLACAPCGHLELPPCGAQELPACMLALSAEDALNTAKAQLSQG